MDKLTLLNDYYAHKKAEKAVSPEMVKERKKLMDAAKSFEAFFTGMVFKSMREADDALFPDEDRLIKKNAGEKIFSEMLDTQYAQNAAETSSNGFANMVYNSLKDSLTLSLDQVKKGKSEMESSKAEKNSGSGKEQLKEINKAQSTINSFYRDGYSGAENSGMKIDISL